MYIYGKNVAIETLKKKKKINKAILYKNFKEEEILNLLIKNNIKIKYLEKYEMDKIVNGLHQGIILEIDEVETIGLEEFLNKIKEKKYPTVVMLDHLEDPHNFGAIIRTSEALGIDGIIIPNDRSVGVNGTVVKTSAGATSFIKVARVININETIKYLKENDVWIYGTDMNTDKMYYDEDMTGNVALVIGSEGFGMSRLVEENCDFLIKIPMKGKITSLNASVSAGIVMYEVVKQRTK